LLEELKKRARKKFEFLSTSPLYTEELAFKISRKLNCGNVLALVGELGTGKTTFVRGLVKGLGMGKERMVKSPTFTLFSIYPASKTIYHFDLYRIDEEDFIDIGGLEYLQTQEGIVVLEWAEKVKLLLPMNTILIEFFHSEFSLRDTQKRKIVIYTPYQWEDEHFSF